MISISISCPSCVNIFAVFGAALVFLGKRKKAGMVSRDPKTRPHDRNFFLDTALFDFIKQFDGVKIYPALIIIGNLPQSGI